MVGNPFADASSNIEKINIDDKVRQRLQEIEIQLNNMDVNTEEYQRLQTEQQVLNELKMPDSLRQILAKTPEELASEVQLQIQSDSALLNQVSNYEERLHQLEELSKTSVKVRELLMVHQLYMWLKPDLSYTGYRNYEKRPNFDEVLQRLFQGELIETYKNDEAVQILKDAIADGFIEVLPADQIRKIITTMDSIRSTKDEGYITAYDCRTVPYYNQILYGEKLPKDDEMKQFYGDFNPIPKDPNQVFEPIRDYVETLPKELMNFGTNYAEIFEFGLVPGNKKYIEKIDSVRNQLIGVINQLQQNIEQSENYLATVDANALYETKTNDLMKKTDAVLKYLKAFANLERFQPATKLSASEIEHLTQTYTIEDLQAISLAIRNPNVCNLISIVDSYNQQLALYDDKFMKECDDFKDLFAYLYAGTQLNEFRETNLQHVFEQYYRSMQGETIDPKNMQIATHLKQNNPELFDRIITSYNKPEIKQAYENLQIAKQNMTEDAIKSKMKKTVGLFGIGKKEVEEEKRDLEVQAKQAYTLAEDRWKKANSEIRKSFIPEFKRKFAEIKESYPDAKFISTSGEEISIDKLEEQIGTNDDYISCTVSSNNIKAAKEKMSREKLITQVFLGNLTQYNQSLQKYMQDENRPPFQVVHQIAAGTYEKDMMRSEVTAQIKENLTKENSISV